MTLIVNKPLPGVFRQTSNNLVLAYQQVDNYAPHCSNAMQPELLELENCVFANNCALTKSKNIFV